MKELLKKELSFTALKLSYLFILFSVMTMFPGYPILTGAFFMCMGIFYTFQSAREQNDVLYTALLPVKKLDVVTARYLFVIILELAGFVICAALTILRMTLLADLPVYTTNVLMNANLVYLGFVLLIFTVFNTLFVGGFWKSAYYIGKPFLLFCIGCFFVLFTGEALHHFSNLEFLNSPKEKPGIQAMILLFSIIIYTAATFASWKSSQKHFEKIDL